MPVGSGLVAQIGVATETTAGTRVAPSRHFEFTSENIKRNINWINSNGLRAGRRTQRRYAMGTSEVTGGFDMEVAPQGFGLLLKHAMGGVVTTGAGPYTHTFTPGDLDDKTATVQVGRPDITGTVRPFDYLGSSIPSWSLSAAVNDFLKAHFDVYAMEEQTNQTLTTATYPATLTPFSFVNGSLTIDAVASCVKSFEFNADNALATGRFQICATAPGFPKLAKEQGIRTYGGKFVADFISMAEYTKYVAGTISTLVLTFASGTTSLTVTMKVRYDGETPSVGGPDLLEQNISFTCTDPTSDANAITIVLVNSDTSP